MSALGKKISPGAGQNCESSRVEDRCVLDTLGPKRPNVHSSIAINPLALPLCYSLFAAEEEAGRSILLLGGRVRLVLTSVEEKLLKNEEDTRRGEETVALTSPNIADRV